MMFNKYEKDGRTIEATELAYRVIYAAQGYVPQQKKAKEATSNDTGGSDSGSHSKGQAPRRGKST